MDERLRAAPIGVLDVAPDGTVEGVNDAARDLMDAGDADLAGAPVAEAFPQSVENSLPTAVGGEIAAAEFEEFYPALDRWLAVSVVPTDDGAVVYVDDATPRRRREQTVERLRAERERTAVIDELLSAVLADLVGASSREEIAETVCDRLGGTERYEFAWVGDREVGGDGLVVRAAAGATGDTFDAVRDALDGDATTPEERAVEQGEVQTVKPLADDPGAPESIRVAGFADGVQSVLAVPLTYGSSVYGVLGVYASERDAFSARERSRFETLGEVAGFAVTAARNRSLLFADSVTELTVEVSGGAPLGALAATLDAEISLDGAVPRGDDALLCYVSIAGAESVADADAPGVADCRVIEETSAGASAAVELRDGPLRAASSLGATIRDATFEGDAGRVVVDLPPDGDVRRTAAAMGRDWDAEVVAKRERERSATTARDLREDVTDRLTEKRETALRAAYLADYFESPRGSSAAEVAASIDIADSTLLYHLRAGQRTLLDALFGES